MTIHPKQVQSRQTLDTISNKTAGAELDNLLKVIDQELQAPLSLRRKLGSTHVVSVGAITSKSEITANNGQKALVYKAYLDASSLGSQLDAALSPGDYFIVSVAGTILTDLVLVAGDYLIVTTAKGAGTPTNSSGFSVGRAGTDRNRTISPVGGTIPLSFNESTADITFSSSSGGNVTAAGNGATAVAYTMSANHYQRVGISLSSLGILTFTMGTGAATAAAATIPAVPGGNLALGHVLVKRDAGTVIEPLTNESVFNYAVGGSGGGGLVPETKTTSFTAEDGKFYLIDTSGGNVTVTIPNIVTQFEVMGFEKITSDTNDVILTPHASDNIEGATVSYLTSKREWKTLYPSSISTWQVQTASIGSGAIIDDLGALAIVPSAAAFGTVTGNEWAGHRIGNRLKAHGYFKTGTVTASIATFALPAGMTVDSTKMQSNVDTVIGRWIKHFNTQTNVYSGSNGVLVWNDSAQAIRFSSQTEATSNGLYVPLNGNASFVNGDALFVEIDSLPILEWANSGTTVTINDLTAKTKWVGTSACSVSNSNGGTVTFANFRATKDSLGKYALDYEIEITGASSSTGHTITLGLGTTFPFTIASSQAIGTTGGFGQANAGAATLLQVTDTAVTSVRIAGHATLVGKPTWFDANAENAVAIDAYISEATLNTTGVVKNPNLSEMEPDDASRTLVYTDPRTQTFTGLASGKTCTLPTSGILAGDMWTLENQTEQQLTVNSFNGTEISIANGSNNNATIGRGYVKLRSKVSTPTTPAHWEVVELYESGTFALNGDYDGGNALLVRNNRSVVLTVTNPSWAGSLAAVQTTTNFIPARFRLSGSTTYATINGGDQSTQHHRIYISSHRIALEFVNAALTATSATSDAGFTSRSWSQAWIVS